MALNIEIEIEGERALWWFVVEVTYLGNERTMDDPGCGPDWNIVDGMGILNEPLSVEDDEDDLPFCTRTDLMEDLGGEEHFEEVVTEYVNRELTARDERNDDASHSPGGYRF